jgi:hypothetical protein
MVPSKVVRSFVTTVALAMLAALTFCRASVAAGAQESACRVFDDEYRVVESVLVKDTLFGAADGVYPLGSGTLRLRMEAQAGQQAVKLMSYEFASRLTVESKIPVFSATVVTESRASAGLGSAQGSADGTLRDGTLTWATPITGYHSEGSIACSGMMCGRFGAPPRGMSPIPDSPATVRFDPFRFSADGATFTMPYALVSRSTSPRQSTYMAMSGRRVRRSCADALQAL